MLAIALAVLVIGFTRTRLTTRFHEIKATSDVYALPSPEQTVVVSLGWRSALADLIFSNVLVSYGIHLQERRRFEFVGNYLETINELDPKFRAPYRYADTLLTLGTVAPHPEDYARARKILERGMQELPHDGELWTQAGQFMAYLAPSTFKDEELKKEWKLEGARRLARACELVGHNENMPYHCITAATLLSKAGEREATIQFLERVLTVVDDEQVRALAAGYLNRTVGERERDEVHWRVERFANVWHEDLSYVSKDALLTVGPPIDAARCAGGAAGCSASWRAWGERVERR
ncbi:MAG: hypothetical protein HS104_08885 [Polyangiaceae bacterium]|nr:hypothetical protein [Polyangiaceae bacterium]MCL4751268.1 hypothetical protein [Myxococcales bacterium]